MIDEMVLAHKSSVESGSNKILEIKIDLFECITIRLPENFYKLSNEEAKKRYAFESRPEIIYSNDGGSVNFTFHLLRDKNLAPSIGVSEIMDSIKLLYPNILIYEENHLSPDEDGCEIRYCDFRTSSLEGPIYNIIYLASNNNDTVMGSFNCQFQEYPNWKSTALSAIRTIFFQ